MDKTKNTINNFFLCDELSFISQHIIKNIPKDEAEIIKVMLEKVINNEFVFEDEKEQEQLVNAIEIYYKYKCSPYSTSKSRISDINAGIKCYTKALNTINNEPTEIKRLNNSIKSLLEVNQHNYVTGFLNYFMTIPEIVDSLKSSLKDVRILNLHEFDKLDRNQWFECGSNITRILGAKYLKNYFNENGVKNFDVPEFIVVVENCNDNKTLQIKLHLDNDFPMAVSILNAKIYSRKIIGEPVAIYHLENEILRYCKYVDLYGDNGNIIRDDDTGVDYVVDTEANSFDIMKNKMDCLPFKCPTNWRRFLLFSKYYFWATNNVDRTRSCVVDVIV